MLREYPLLNRIFRANAATTESAKETVTLDQKIPSPTSLTQIKFWSQAKFYNWQRKYRSFNDARTMRACEVSPIT